MPEAPFAERRRHARLSRKFLIKFRVIGGPVPRDTADRVGQIYNISKGGVLLLSKRPLPPGTILDLKFPENVFGGEARTFQGIVCRAGAETAGGDQPLGLKFVRVNPPSKGPAAAAPAPPAAQVAQERRGSTRSTQKLLIKLRCISSGVFEEFEPRGGFLLNISEAGMEILTNRDYAPGSALAIHLPENPLGPARNLVATVVWTKPGEKPGYFILGTRLETGAAPPRARG